MKYFAEFTFSLVKDRDSNKVLNHVSVRGKKRKIRILGTVIKLKTRFFKHTHKPKTPKT